MKINDKIYNLRNVVLAFRQDMHRNEQDVYEIGFRYTSSSLDTEIISFSSKEERDDVFLEIETLIDMMEKSY